MGQENTGKLKPKNITTNSSNKQQCNKINVAPPLPPILVTKVTNLKPNDLDCLSPKNTRPKSICYDSPRQDQDDFSKLSIPTPRTKRAMSSPRIFADFENSISELGDEMENIEKSHLNLRRKSKEDFTASIFEEFGSEMRFGKDSSEFVETINVEIKNSPQKKIDFKPNCVNKNKQIESAKEMLLSSGEELPTLSLRSNRNKDLHKKMHARKEAGFSKDLKALDINLSPRNALKDLSPQQKISEISVKGAVLSNKDDMMSQTKIRHNEDSIKSVLKYRDTKGRSKSLDLTDLLTNPEFQKLFNKAVSKEIGKIHETQIGKDKTEHKKLSLSDAQKQVVDNVAPPKIIQQYNQPVEDISYQKHHFQHMFPEQMRHNFRKITMAESVPSKNNKNFIDKIPVARSIKHKIIGDENLGQLYDKPPEYTVKYDKKGKPIKVMVQDCYEEHNHTLSSAPQMFHLQNYNKVPTGQLHRQHYGPYQRPDYNDFNHNNAHTKYSGYKHKPMHQLKPPPPGYKLVQMNDGRLAYVKDNKFFNKAPAMYQGQEQKVEKQKESSATRVADIMRSMDSDFMSHDESGLSGNNFEPNED